MSIFRRWLGTETFEDERSRGEALLASGDFGHAKLSFERALERARAEPIDVRKALEDRIAECCDALARKRVDEASRLAAAHQTELAREELEGALEIARTAELRQAIQLELDRVEQDDAVEQAAPAPDLSDEEQMALLAGTWQDDQAAEYETYGRQFDRALMALHAGRAAEAREQLAEIAHSAPDPHYLYLELARAELASGDDPAAEASYRLFLSRIGPDEGGDARFGAHLDLARLSKDFEGAVAELERAVDSLAGDYRPLFVLGQFLRESKHAAEAVEVLTSASELMDEQNPDWRVLQELGLAQADAGQSAAATETLEAVVGYFVARKHLDFPPSATTTLAQLHEANGKTQRAADLYRALASGSDRPRLASYNRQAARLVRDLGLLDETRRLLQRALGLAEPESEERAAIEADLLGDDLRN